MLNVRVSADSGYFSELRMPLISLAQGTPKRVLEIGCASGQTLAYFKEHGAEWVVGVELSDEVAETARARSEVDQVLTGNVETMTLPFEEASFDLIITGHVLEHLTDPWAVLRELRTLLKPGGQLIGALPNIRNVRVVLPLLLVGRWRYEKSGLMDWTHLRFFTASTIVELLKSCEFEIAKIVPEFSSTRAGFFNRLTLGLMKNLFCYAYNFSAFKPRAPKA
jgi:SAM-dependent methyltransferase